jgi:hypothetical protein
MREAAANRLNHCWGRVAVRSLPRLGRMTTNLEVVQNGKCEELKLGVHAAALGLVAVMGLYNAAAWLSRRQRLWRSMR